MAYRKGYTEQAIGALISLTIWIFVIIIFTFLGELGV